MFERFWKPYVSPDVCRNRSTIRIGSAVGFVANGTPAPPPA